MTNIIYRTIFRSTTKYVVLKNVFQFTSGILSIFVVRLLTPAEFGKWSLVYQLIATIGPIVNLGFLSTLSRFMPEYKTKEEKDALFSSTMKIVLVTFALFFVLYWIAINAVPKLFPVEIKSVKYLFCVFVGLLSIINLIEGFYRGIGKFNEWTVIDGIRSVLSVAITILFIFSFGPDFKSVFYSYFIVILLFFMILAFTLKNHINLYKKIEIEKVVINYSLVMLIGQVLFMLATTMDSVLLRILLKDPSQVGYYNAGIRIPKILETMFISPLSVPFLFYFSSHETAIDKKKMFEFGTRIFGVLFGFLAILIFTFSKFILTFLFGMKYLNSIPVLQVYVLGIFFLGFAALIGPYLMSINKPNIAIIIGFIAVLLFMSVAYFLIPCYKSVGSAISSIIAVSIQAFVLTIILKKYNLECIKMYLILAIALVISVILGYIINMFVAMPLFIIIVILTGLVRKDDYAMFKKMII